MGYICLKSTLNRISTREFDYIERKIKAFNGAALRGDDDMVTFMVRKVHTNGLCDAILYQPPGADLWQSNQVKTMEERAGNLEWINELWIDLPYKWKRSVPA